MKIFLIYFGAGTIGLFTTILNISWFVDGKFYWPGMILNISLVIIWILLIDTLFEIKNKLNKKE